MKVIDGTFLGDGKAGNAKGSSGNRYLWSFGYGMWIIRCMQQGEVLGVESMKVLWTGNSSVEKEV